MKHLAFWTERSSDRDSLGFIKELALLHAQKGGHQGSSIAGLIAGDRFLELCEFVLDYANATVYEASNCRQALAFFKKCTYLPLGVDRQARAESKFRLAEERCRQTNQVFDLRDQGLFNFEPWVDRALARARQKISRILGELPKLSELDFKFGPGATTLTKKRMASVAEKLSAGFSCSEDLLPYASRVIEEIPAFFQLHEIPGSQRVTEELFEDDWCEVCEYGRAPVVVTPGRVNFVPKDATTDRTIIVEGSLNVLVQGAIGRFMFARLKTFGIDLTNQELNQKLALEGSLTGELATLDLVSASDMMAIAIVKELLPWEWYFFLSTARSSVVTLGGETMIQEKFSSMGNGYTFPLQSLLFYALASSVDDSGRVSVYGDDIICRTDSSGRVMRLLEVCGFEVNRKKSYWSGPFRESCGADYISGINIRPWYHRDQISQMDLFRLHNFYVRHDSPDMADFIKSFINEGLRIYGPDGYGDGHLLGEWLPRGHKKALTHGYGGVLFDTFKLKPVRDKRFGRKGDKVLPVYTIYVRENAERVLPDVSFEDSFPRDECGLTAMFRYGRYLRIRRALQSRVAVEPLPEVVDRRGKELLVIKAPALPGTYGYVKVSIYTFDSSNR